MKMFAVVAKVEPVELETEMAAEAAAAVGIVVAAGQSLAAID